MRAREATRNLFRAVDRARQVMTERQARERVRPLGNVDVIERPDRELPEVPDGEKTTP